MKTKFINILLLLIFTIGVSSCIHESFPECVIDEDPTRVPKLPDDVHINLSVSLLTSVNDAATRTENFNIDGKDNYFEPAISKYEKIHTLRVIIVRGERTFPIEYVKDSTGYIEHNQLFSIGDNGAVRYDDMSFKVRSGEKKKIYFIANEEFIKDNTDFDFDKLKVRSVYPTNSIENIILSRSSNSPMINNEESSEHPYYIPMGECFDEVEVPLPQNPEDYQISYEDFFMTRAAVKFSFIVNFGENSDYAKAGTYVKDITVDGFAEKEFFLPNNTVYSDPITDPVSKLTGRIITSYDIPEPNININKKYSYTTHIRCPENGYQSAFIPYLYFPESVSDTQYSVSITLANSENEDLITFDPATLDNLSSLPRNTHVLVKIDLLRNGIEIVEVKVVPYVDISLYPGYGIFIDESGNEVSPEISWPENSYQEPGQELETPET